MNAEEYRSLINQKDILDHTTLDNTLKEVVSRQEFELAENIKRMLKNNKIDKPTLHSKPYDLTSTYYKVDLDSDDIEKIIDIFFDLEVEHIGKDGETTPTASFYASLVNRWNELI